MRINGIEVEVCGDITAEKIKKAEKEIADTMASCNVKRVTIKGGRIAFSLE